MESIIFFSSEIKRWHVSTDLSEIKGFLKVGSNFRDFFRKYQFQAFSHTL